MAGEKWTSERVPKSAQRLFRMCWQLENWLRTILYVELRAARVDWETPIQRLVADWPPHSIAHDKRLHHMKTPHQAALSYLAFGQLWSIISDAANWPLFKPYFPPRDNAEVRIEEVKAIRNRVAHFRDSHPLDEARLELFLRDMEPGIRRFCSRYTVGQVAENRADDPVSTELERLWEKRSCGIELMRPGRWLYAPEPHTKKPLLSAGLDLLPLEGYQGKPGAGVIYAIRLQPDATQMDVVGFFEQTKPFHGAFIHILLSQSCKALSVTLPAVHGPRKTTEVILEILAAGLNNSRGLCSRPVNQAQLQWPEYVLWPDHILTSYCDGGEEPVLDLS